MSIDIPVSDLQWVETDVGIRCAGSQRCARVRPNNLERGGSCGIQAKHIGEGQNVEHTGACADDRFAAMKRIPFNPDARFEIFGGWICENRTVDAYRSTRGWTLGAIRQTNDLLKSGRRDGVSGDGISGNPVGIRRASGHFVSQAEVYGNVGTQAPVILQVACEQALAEAD